MDIRTFIKTQGNKLSPELRAELVGLINPTREELAEEIKRICKMSKQDQYYQNKCIDTLLGFNINKVEKEIEGYSKSHLGDAAWSERNDRAIENYLTSYKTFHNLLNDIVKKHNIKTIVDLGCAYGRLGIIVGLFHPNINFIGYEINKHRYEEAKRIANKFSLSNVTYRNQDLSCPSFQVPKACLYYAYDPVNEVTRIKIFEKDIPEHRSKYILAARETAGFSRYLSECEHLAKLGMKFKGDEYRDQRVNLYIPVGTK